MFNVKVWRTTHDGINYSAKIDGIKLELTRDSGTKESYGGKSLLARHFLTKPKWQNHVKEIFGDQIFNEVFLKLEMA